MHIIVAGNPVDGFEFYGPFDSKDEAVEWADGLPEDWWVGEVINPHATDTALEEGTRYERAFGDGSDIG